MVATAGYQCMNRKRPSSDWPSAFRGYPVSRFWKISDFSHTFLGPLMAEAVEKLLKNPFSAEIGEHCQIAEFLSY
jgi:hypothetical protein